MTIATEYERYMLELINIERAKVGAPPLQLEKNLNTSADAHSAWMLQEDIFSHTGVDGSSATQRIRDADFDLSGSWRTAENIAVQSERGPDGIMDDVENLHVSLMNSPGHRANILNPDLDYIGIGIALGDFDFSSGTYESVIVTQNFASTGGRVDLDVENVTPPAEPTEISPPVAVAPPPVEEPVEPTTPVVVTPDPEPSTPVAKAPAISPAITQKPASAPVESVTADPAADFFAFLQSGPLAEIDIFASGPSTMNVSAAQSISDQVQSQYATLLAGFELDAGPVQVDDFAI